MRTRWIFIENTRIEGVLWLYRISSFDQLRRLTKGDFAALRNRANEETYQATIGKDSVIDEVGDAVQMQIMLNGEEYLGKATSLAGLVAELALEPEKIAVERNRVIVPRSQWQAEPVNAGDQVEIIQFVGGG